MNFDTYTLYARVVPAILTMLPLTIFHHFFVNPEFLSFTSAIVGLQILLTVSMSVIFLILVIEINRAISIMVFEQLYFKGRINMPTTRLLMYSDNRLSNQLKSDIREKIKVDFNISLPTRRQEESNIDAARRRISEAVMLIRGRVPPSTLLTQYNTQYGFMRNLIGGSLLACVISIGNIYFFSQVFHSDLAIKLSIVLSMVYILPIVLSYLIMTHYGYKYAEYLIREYLLQKQQ
jgi:hypothetical protein